MMVAHHNKAVRLGAADYWRQLEITTGG